MKKIYLDHVATNPLHPEVLDAMMPYFKEHYGNPLSLYEPGMKAREAIENARVSTAELINAKAREIIFTASGAESNNFALKGIAYAFQNKGKHIIVSKVEHHSVLNSARFLEKQGFAVTYLPVDNYGLVNPSDVEKAITDETILISIIHASPEIGTIQPIAEISRIAKEKGIIVHTDSVASAGNIPVDVLELNVDLMTFAAHQFYGPKGAAALYVREGTRIVPLIYGGIQEGGRRAGTENVPAIVGMGKAAEITKRDLQKRIDHVTPLRDSIIGNTLKTDKVILTGHPEKRLPGHASFVVEYIEGEAMLLMLAAKGIYSASGSACSSKALKSSPVLISIGIPVHLAQGSVVFTLGEGTTGEDINYFNETFPQIISRLREISPYAKGWEETEAPACTAKK
ncbi:MAG TPA: cysteine desulfurase [Nitrospirae bacterium]|nr:cysteine desulfurase [bacterium BMS3Abin06]HDH11890.1 cysteine desulfurase [Nitrospirota bacterium]HDZ02768.1 cysteine desulfurase [Nitrospirota bacterium]